MLREGNGCVTRKGGREIVSEKKQYQVGGEGNGKAVEECVLLAVFTKNYVKDQVRKH